MRKRLEWIGERKYWIIKATVLSCLAVFFLWEASKSRQAADCFFQNSMIRSEGGAWDSEWMRKAIQQQYFPTEDEETEEGEGSESFAVWTELAEETVSTGNGGNERISDVIVVYGSSYCLLPIGKNLFPEDAEGCILGTGLAEELFGGHQAEGQQIFWRGKNWTVRGVVEEPSHFLMVQGTEFVDSVSFDRISIACSGEEDGKDMGDEFISRHGLSARTLRFDHRYGWGWLTEMIPSRWSDFDGWKQNLETHQKEVEFVKNTDKSVIEAVGIEKYNRSLFCLAVGVLCLFIVLVDSFNRKTV